MPIIASTTASTYAPCPAGNHLAICYQMVEIGTEVSDFQGQKKSLHRVRLTWELPNERKIFNPDKGEQPYSLSRDYTLSMHEKATLRKDLESWRGKAFNEDEAKSFDVTRLMGKPCLLNIIHTEKDGKTFANIAGVAAIIKGMEIPKQENPSFVFSYLDSTKEDFLKLPEWLQERMKKTPEYSKFIHGGHEEIAPEPQPSDDLPF